MKSKKKNPKKILNVRLSKEVVPLEYDIQLKPDLQNFTFSGIETISLSLVKTTKKLILHTKEIEVETVSISEGKNKVFAHNISYDEKSETVTFTFKESLTPGKKKLNIVFKGILNDKMRGFYKSTYVLDGKDHHIATTQFEATDARKAFPCFDEPAHKAIFHVSLVVEKGKTAISNTLPTSIKEHEAGYDIVRFAPTPKMSTYLLAFIVGDFEFIEKKSKRGVIVRVYTTPGKTHQAKFALETTVKVLDFYEEYFDIDYPLNTLDMIAIPDFSSLAMENWGAITFREIGLLVDENNTSIGSKEMVAEVIAHELAHQWFGNLVTMEWWTHLWLNEGFASYIPYLVIDKLFPSWNIWERFTTDTHGIALRLDALATTHPIEVEVHHPDEIGEIFDAVSYSKGASVIRMIADYIGPDKFRDGLRHYLKKHSYKNTETEHLWQSFERISKKPIEKIMRNWTGKSGYPVIKAEIVKDKLILTQDRFFSSPVSKSKSKDKTIWQVPIQTNAHDNLNQFLLETKSIKLGLPKSWIKINDTESGFFRTAYSRELLERLQKPVEDKTLPAEDRLGLIRDLFALCEAGTIPTNDTLEFLRSYTNEDSYIVWVEIASGLVKLEQMLAKTKLKSELNKYMLELFSPLAHTLGWQEIEDEVHTNKLLRSLAISRAGRAGDKDILNQAKNIFNLMLENKPVNPDLRSTVYSIVATHGGEKEHKILTERYKKETLHEEQNRIGGALGDFQNPALLKETCKFALSSNVRTQDTVSILSGVAYNPIGRDIWWNFLSSNWTTFVSRYGEGGLTLGRMVKGISGSAEQKHLDNFKIFFKSHEAPGAKRSIEQVCERLESNIAWLKRDEQNIKKFFRKN